MGAHYFGIITLILGVILMGQGMGATAQPSSQLQTQFTGTVGTNLDSQENEASFTLEPLLKYPVSSSASLVFYTAIDRPFDRTENFAIPKTLFAFQEKFDWSGFNNTASIALTFVSLDNWGDEGAMVRPNTSIRFKRNLAQGLDVALQLGPYLQLSAYKQKRDGSNNPRFGFNERLDISYKTGRVLFDVRLYVEQKYTGSWANNYTTLQALSYELSNSVSLGVSHELLSSIVDASTGRYKSVQLFDGRKSRVSVFVGITL